MINPRASTTPRTRLRRLLIEPTARSSRLVQFSRVVGLAVWIGLLTGLVETALMFGLVISAGAGTLGSLQMNRHALWMITLSDVAIFTALGGACAVVCALVQRRWVTQVVFWFLVGLGCFALLQLVHGLTILASASLAAGIAATFARRLDAHGPRFATLRRRTLPIFAIAALGLVAAQFSTDAAKERSHLAGLTAARSGAPNVLFIVLDTVRADALGCYGYNRPTTPNLDALAARGVRFEQARSPGAWTLPSHASMFTSRWPHELSARIDTPLDTRFPTIAEHMADHGYATAGFIANTFFCNAWFGLGRGFAHYDDMALTPPTILRTSHLGRRLLRSFGTERHERPTSHFSRKDAATINREFLGWLDGRADQDNPFFVFINYFDAHDPYLMPRPEAKPFGRQADTAEQVSMLRNWNLLDGKKLSADQLALARDCYDDCLAQLDREVGRLVSQLESRGLLESTWIVVTSDHGEQFGEHGFIGHGNSVHRQTVHVPLLIIPPSKSALRPGVIAPPVSLRDLPSTVVDITGAKPPESGFAGRSLARFWDGRASGDSLADTVVLSEIVDHEGPVSASWQMPKSLVSGGYVYIRQCDGREDLFHAASDPDETQSLSGLPEHAARMEQFRKWLREFE